MLKLISMTVSKAWQVFWITAGTFVFGGIGLYVSDRWGLEEKERKHKELEEKLEDLKSRREKLEMQIQSDNT
jgi:hypothetical protein